MVTVLDPTPTSQVQLDTAGNNPPAINRKQSIAEIWTQSVCPTPQMNEIDGTPIGRLQRH